MRKPSKDELEAWSAYYADDSAFAANARLLQSKWRDSMGYSYSKYGNLLEVDFAKSTGANYLTDNIFQLVEESVLKAKMDGAMIGEPRIWNNLLSSQPLCFNLFGELYLDLGLATRFFKTLFPGRIDRVNSIKFEYSAGRGDKQYTGDHSAFDVFVEYEYSGSNGFIGIEVKYAESLKEESKDKAAKTYTKHKTQYERLTSEDLFVPNALNLVRQVPISQIWRDHLLSLAHLKDYNEGFFVFLYPKNNENCQKGVDEYKKYLKSSEENINGFYPRTLEEFIDALKSVSNAQWIYDLENRYLGF